MEFDIKHITNPVLSMQLLHEEFKRDAMKLSMICSSSGFRVRPYKDGLPHFGKLSADKQVEIIRSIKFYIELCQEQLSEGSSLRDNLSFTWKALRKLGLTPKSDLFSLIKDDDIIEIYNGESRQVYRNLRYYDFCSYSIEELYSLEWWNLFSRDDGEITRKLFEESNKLLTGEVEGHIFSETKEHVVTELASAELLSNKYRAKLLSPLTVNKTAQAFMVVIEANPLAN
ncbi:hypothetical protein [Bdellovibrio sp. NC01]|uniref:hypothetical protein n=1 Tax=Bdellovibrio sp. NC01 TaxID=2220073 RepID=UPI0011574726|nr:hypothetical protein [Bdellovibrio sp. NC01]QDK38304.1 hypothetical protein DOE51_12310 [Bdellovibrio sp. NC01]